MSKGQSLQDPFLNALRKEKVPSFNIFSEWESSFKGKLSHLTNLLFY